MMVPDRTELSPLHSDTAETLDLKIDTLLAIQATAAAAAVATLHEHQLNQLKHTAVALS